MSGWFEREQNIGRTWEKDGQTWEKDGKEDVYVFAVIRRVDEWRWRFCMSAISGGGAEPRIRVRVCSSFQRWDAEITHRQLGKAIHTGSPRTGSPVLGENRGKASGGTREKGIHINPAKLLC